jgi:hypothetical protein
MEGRASARPGPAEAGPSEMQWSCVRALAEANLCPLLFAEDNPRFGQVVGRQFHRDLVSGHDTNEMLAHFAGDVSQDVALTGQIDAKHRAG